MPTVQQVEQGVKALDHKDVWVRAGKTAVQAFVASGVVAVVDVQHAYVAGGLNAAKAAALAAVVGVGAAVVSAVWNYAVAIGKA